MNLRPADEASGIHRALACVWLGLDRKLQQQYGVQGPEAIQDASTREMWNDVRNQVVLHVAKGFNLPVDSSRLGYGEARYGRGELKGQIASPDAAGLTAQVDRHYGDKPAGYVYIQREAFAPKDQTTSGRLTSVATAILHESSHQEDVDAGRLQTPIPQDSKDSGTMSLIHKVQELRSEVKAYSLELEYADKLGLRGEDRALVERYLDKKGSELSFIEKSKAFREKLVDMIMRF